MIDVQALLAPIPGDSPAGADLRYTQIYDNIKEARRADDELNRGDWGRDIKTSDWATVIKLATDALSSQTKDLQIASWLTEALVKTKGFEGLSSGLSLINGLLEQYWDVLYPLIEDGDMEYRAGPFEFMNDKLWHTIKSIALTDPSKTPGHSWLVWQDSRKVGTEKDILNQFGDVDEKKRQAREALIAEGKLTAEEFDSAVSVSAKDFYEKLSEALASCMAEFDKMDAVVDTRFGKEAPRLSEMKAALADCEQLVSRILKEKRIKEPDKKKPKEEAQKAAEQVKPDSSGDPLDAGVQERPSMSLADAGGAAMFQTFMVQDQSALEEALWEDAVETVKVSGIKEALEKLSRAMGSASSIRQQNRYMLLIAKLCLKVDRPDLARPVVEQIYNLIAELNLERWESPTWIAEVIDAYYQCLTSETSSEEDKFKAKTELFQKLCTRDITKAFVYRG